MVTGQADLEQGGVIFPKLFRRLSEFLGQQPGGVDGFLPLLAATDEQVLDLTRGQLHPLRQRARVQQARYGCCAAPRKLVFVSAKTTSPTVAPWLRH